MDPVTVEGAVPSEVAVAAPEIAVAAAGVVILLSLVKYVEQELIAKRFGLPIPALTKLMGPALAILIAYAITRDPTQALLVAGMAVLGFDQTQSIKKWGPLLLAVVQARFKGK